MLGSFDPVIIFQIYTKVPEATLANIQLTSGTQPKTTSAIIPIYLSENETGLFVDSESKNIDIDSQVDSLSSGAEALVNQKALGSIVSVKLFGKRNSIGLTILLALAEMILDKVTSAEYEVTYMHESVTVFGGLIHGISIEPGANDDRLNITLELSRGRPKSTSVQVDQDPTAVRVGTVGTTPPAGAPTVSAPPGGVGAGNSVIVPGQR